ncbi:MAG: hypothetical protein M2R45_00399 [Verrucomicrobia subdivision 3 bacterium]|nr:hypothetical protein [Limisphaerales bacterium]MCS1412842.1 hypothetical protein [Limisphaerales bacterium]
MACAGNKAIGVCGGVNDNTLLLRQIHPNWIQDDVITSQAFTPTPKDSQELSVYDGDQITPEQSWNHYTDTLKNVSAGVVAVAVSECKGAGTTARPDPEPFPQHAVIDFGSLSRSKTKKIGKILAKHARERGWQYQSGEPA